MKKKKEIIPPQIPLSVYKLEHKYWSIRYFARNYLVSLKQSLKFIFYAYRYRRGLSHLKDCKGTKKNKEVLIVANGPSAAKLSAEKVARFQNKDNEVWVMNSFHLNPKMNKIKPNIYFFSDHMDLSVENAKKLKKFPKLMKEKLDLIERVQSLDHIIGPLDRIDDVRTNFPSKNFLGYVDIFSRYLGGVSPVAPFKFISATVLKSISVARHLGYKKIYIIGIDTSYGKDVFSDKGNKIFLKETSSGGDKHIGDLTNYYKSTADFFFDLAELLNGFNMLKDDSIINLQQDCIVTCFQKEKINASKFI